MPQWSWWDLEDIKQILPYGTIGKINMTSSTRGHIIILPYGWEVPH